MSNQRVLVIAFDACEKDLLGKWASEGLLPNVQKLREASVSGITTAPPGLFVGAVWPSFWTSRSPDVHGRYCYEQFRPGTYENMPISPRDTDAPPWWQQLSDSGRRVAVIDVPKTYPTKGINGIHICDWGTHDPDHKMVTTEPPELAAEVIARFGVDTIRNCNAYAQSPEKLRELSDHLRWRIDRKTDLILHYLEQEPWDCFVAVFSDSHCAGHQCWHLYDTTDIHYSEDAAEVAGNPLKEVYIALDRALGRIVEAAGDAYDFVLLASHGFRSHYDATFMLDEILMRMERPAAVNRKKTTSFAKRAWMTLPAGVRGLLKPVKRRARIQLGVPQRKTRKYFQIPNNDAVGAIRLNLIGREPEGRVSPLEVDALCDEIRDDLMAFVNVETRETLVRDVVRVDSIYSGPKRDLLPDIFVFWNHDTPVHLIESPKTGQIADKDPRGRTGDHTPQGAFFYRAADISKRALSMGVGIADIGPTLAERLGVPLSNVDGKSFAGALTGKGSGDAV